MQIYLYAEINIFALIILLLIYSNVRYKMDKHVTEQKLFLLLILLNVMILTADSFMWIFDGQKGQTNRLVLITSAAIYYLLHPIICLVWYLYVDYQINRDNTRLKRDTIIMTAPIAVYAAFSILSVFGDFFFYFDSNNLYHRGHFFLLVPAMSFIFIVYTTLYVMLNRRKIYNRFYRSYLFFAVPLIVAAVIQLAFYGLPLIWNAMTISILIIFINIQNEQMNMDYLTGLFNRRQLDFYLKALVKKDRAKIAGILLDINSFKNINDQYGHYTGDEALKYASLLLKETFGHSVFLSRYGGDEFVILLEVSNEEDLSKAIETLKINVVQFNKQTELRYDIDFSIGAALYPGKAVMSEQEFLNYIDSLMYQDKQTLLQFNERHYTL